MSGRLGNWNRGRAMLALAPLLGIALASAALGPAAAVAKPTSVDAPFVAAEVFASKPTVPVEVSFEVLGEPQVGLPVEVILTVTAGADMQGTVIMFSADDPLAIIEPPGDVLVGELAAGDGIELVLTVLPLLDQTHYLGVTVRGAIDGNVQSRSIAVPIRLPGAELAKTTESGSEKSASGVVSFSAVESVR